MVSLVKEEETDIGNKTKSAYMDKNGREDRG